MDKHYVSNDPLLREFVQECDNLELIQQMRGRVGRFTPSLRSEILVKALNEYLTETPQHLDKVKTLFRDIDSLKREEETMLSKVASLQQEIDSLEDEKTCLISNQRASKHSRVFMTLGLCLMAVLLTLVIQFFFYRS